MIELLKLCSSTISQLSSEGVERVNKKPRYAVVLLTIPTVIAMAAAVILMYWHISTRIQVDLTVNRAEFTIGGSNHTQILNSLGFQSVTIEKFSDIRLSPETLEAANPDQYLKEEDRFPDTAWRPLIVTLPVSIISRDKVLQPAVTLEPSGPTTQGRLSPVLVQSGAKVILEVSGNSITVLTIKAFQQDSFTTAHFNETFQLITHYCQFNGVAGLPEQTDSLTLRAQPSHHSPMIEIHGQPRSLILSLTLAPEKTTALFWKGSIPVTALNFTRQTLKGDRETTLIKDGKISYPDYPDMKKVSFKASDFISLDQLEQFQVQEMSLSQEDKGLRLRLSGIAGYIKTGSQEFPQDHRITLFDALWHEPNLAVLFSIVVWVCATTVGAYKLYKEIKR